jgi:hypothetical protein
MAKVRSSGVHQWDGKNRRMKRALDTKQLARHCCITIAVIGMIGCSGSRIQQGSPAAPKQTARSLSPTAAAELAAKLANEECERLYNKRPFMATQYAAVLEDDLYHWGRLDPGGPSGLSAEVTFRKNGSQPDVQVYFSTDLR